VQSSTAGVAAHELHATPDARRALLADLTRCGWSGDELETFLESLDPDGVATAYLFRCRRCRIHLAHADFT